MQPPAASPQPQIAGIVSNFASRFEMVSNRQVLVWNFNLIAEDAAHHRFEVPVQMRGATFDGAIQNGDIIGVNATWKPGQLLQVTAVQNMRTRGTITANSSRQSTPPFLGAMQGTVLVAVVAVAFFVVAFFVVLIAMFVLHVFSVHGFFGLP